MSMELGVSKGVATPSVDRRFRSCGNCSSLLGVRCILDDSTVNLYQECKFEPSKWDVAMCFCCSARRGIKGVLLSDDNVHGTKRNEFGLWKHIVLCGECLSQHTVVTGNSDGRDECSIEKLCIYKGL